MTDTRDLRTIARDMIERLRADRVTPGIEVGERAPSFSLPDATGNIVSLDERLSTGPVVISFYRGAWCPVCSTEMQGLQEVLPRLRELGASLIAISPQGPDASLEFVRKLDLGFDVLSDGDQSVIRAYRLQFELVPELQDKYREMGMDLEQQNADASWNLPVPATFVVDALGIVAARHVDPNYRERMDVEELVAAVTALQ